MPEIKAVPGLSMLGLPGLFLPLQFHQIGRVKENPSSWALVLLITPRTIWGLTCGKNRITEERTENKKEKEKKKKKKHHKGEVGQVERATGPGMMRYGGFSRQGFHIFIQVGVDWQFWLVKVAQLCLILCDSMGYRVQGILQARMLEWVAFPFCRGLSQPRDQTQVSLIAGRFITSWATRETHSSD